MNEDRENAWHVGTAPHTAVIIMNLFVPEAWVPRLGGRQAGRQAVNSEAAAALADSG